MPTDVVVAREADAGAPSRIARADGIAADEMALDIGPRTTAEFVRQLGGAGTIYWNGPMGMFEIRRSRPARAPSARPSPAASP